MPLERPESHPPEHFVEAITSRTHSRPDHERRIGRWQENLTADEVASILPIVAPAAATFGYDLPDPKA